MNSRFQFQKRGASPEAWFRIGAVDVTTTVLVTVLAVVSLFVWAASPETASYLGMFPPRVRSGWLSQLLTWPIANDPSVAVVSHIAVFWWAGSQIEDLLRRRRFSWYLGVIIVVPALLGAVLGIPLFGISALSLAMFCAFAIEYPNAKLLFGIPAWVIAGVYVVIDLLQLTGARDTKMVLLHVVGLALVAMGLRSFGLGANIAQVPAVPFLNRFGAPNSSRAKGVSSSKNRPRSKLSTRQTSATGSSTNNASASTVVQGPWTGENLTQRDVDTLLDKIASDGIDSLSADERRNLEAASKRLRERRE